MTEEQIKNLKVGDKITVDFVVEKVNDTYVNLSFTSGEYYAGSLKQQWRLLKQATLVTPPPAFEVGDTVRIVPDPLTGTIYGNGVNKDEFAGKENKVLEKANEWGNVRIKTHFGSILVNIHCLELVKKAVKDKYRVFNHDTAWGVDCEDGTVAYFSNGKHPNAKAAAMAECARLNAEWRKQQESAAVCDGGVTKGGAE